ncbi:polysaccharide biosynthesis/export family protein [Dyadobacter sp. NIV53]|uniref:polysaccharide biosynthesis/export family protein n=1 Tax=Dyadobacter sp. NIV53 TaxID=2861765 RepID=UPI001C87E0C4|nr:polysaccharide biosynthesis/export family protein [Dyadobacter sp. NIV53]
MCFSCKTVKRVAYFQDIPDSVSQQPSILNLAVYTEPVILSDDILSITIQTIESPLNGFANTISASLPNSSPSQLFSGYQVNKNGVIEIPVLGKIIVGGLTTAMAQDSVYKRASKYFKEPVVAIRFANFTVTVLGEVAKPGSYNLPNEKTSVLEALGIAGDLTIYARRENVLILRNSTDRKHAVRLDLNSTATFRSPYFYVKQHDIIIVEPNKARITASTDGNKTRNYALIASGLSVLIILISRLTF